MNLNPGKHCNGGHVFRRLTVVSGFLLALWIGLACPESSAFAVGGSQQKRVIEVYLFSSAECLPPGNVVLFNEPSTLKPDKVRIVGVIVLIAAEAALIAILLIQRRKRKRAEAGLEKSEARYLAFMDNSSEGISRFEAETPIPLSLSEDAQIQQILEHGYLAECNDAYARMYGVENSKGMVGTRLADLLLPSDPQNVEFLRAFIRSGYRLRDHTTHERDPQGETHWFENSATGIIERNCLVRAWVVQRDITERKLMLEQILSGAEEWQSTFDSIEDLVMIVDRDRRLLKVNEAARSFFTLPAREPVGMNCEALLHGTECPLENCPVKKAFATHQAGEIEFFDGSTKRWYRASAHPMIARGGDVTAVVHLVKDITERKRGETALAASELRYRDLVESSHDWVWEVDDKTVYTYAGPQCREILGYEPEEIIGKTPFDLMPPAEAQRVRLAFAEIEGKRRPFRALENVSLHKQGHPVVLETTGVPIFDAQGNYCGYRGMDRDVTKRRQAEDELRESQVLTNSIIDSTSDLIWAVDAERFGLLSFNTAFRQKFLRHGIHVQRGMRPEDLCTDKNRVARWRGIYQRALSEGSYNTDYESSAGRNTVFAVNLLKRDGKLFGISLFGKDITERKRAERTLQEYEKVVENSEDVMLVLDREYRHLLANRALLEKLGVKREQVIGHTVSEVVGEEFFQRVAKPRIDECFGGETVQFESEFNSRRQGVKSFLVSFYPIYGSHGIDRVCGVMHDIAERKRAEAEITDRLRFESLLAELSSRFVHVPVERIDEEINYALRRVCEFFDLEIGTLWRESKTVPGSITLTHAYGPTSVPPGSEPLSCEELFPWCYQQVKDGKIVAISSLEELPPEAGRDRESWQRFGDKSNLTFGLAVGGSSSVGALSFHHVQAERPWPEPLVKRLEMVAQMFSNALSRHESEQALRESEERFRSLVENATVGIYRTTPDGRILAANPTLVKMLGYADFQSLATRNLEMQGFEPRYPRKAFRERIEKEGQAIGLESAWHRLDGSVIFVRESARAIRGGDGKILCYDGVVEDITQRKRAEEALRRRAAFDELMTGNLSRFAICAPSEVDAAIVKALEGIATFIGVDHAYILQSPEDRSTWSPTHEWCRANVSQRLQQFQSIPFGTAPWAENKLIAGEVVRVNSPKDIPADAVNEHRHREAEGYLAALNVPFRTKTGLMGCIGLHSHARTVTWKDEDVARLRLVGDAVTNALERKQVLEELRKSEEMFSTAFRASPVAMTIVSLATGRYVNVNRAFEEMTGFQAREIVGRTPQEIGRPAAGKDPLRGLETQYQTKSGEVRTWLLSSELVEFGGEVCSLRAGEDITERKRMEQSLGELGARLLMAQETERRRVARELHDDFSQRLALLAIDLEQLAQRPPERKGDWNARLQAMRSRTQELAGDMHRLSYQLHPSKLEDLGLAAAVRSYCRDLSRQAGIDIIFSDAGVPRDLPKETSLCIYRIVQEALGNIVKHSGAKTAEVALGGGPQEVQLVISDPGKGFAVEDAQAGKGLGLVSMQERVRYVGGSWSIEARPSEGTRVVVRIPLSSQQAAEAVRPVSGVAESSESRSKERSRTRVLLADDHTLLLEAFKGLLEPEFEIVGTATDGRAALEAVEELKPEVVVLDIAMPLLNGLDAARQIRSTSPDAEVIFLTMNPDPELAQEAMRLGASGYLLKTSAASELRSAIREAVRGAKYVTPSIQEQGKLFVDDQ